MNTLSCEYSNWIIRAFNATKTFFLVLTYLAGTFLSELCLKRALVDKCGGAV